MNKSKCLLSQVARFLFNQPALLFVGAGFFGLACSGYSCGQGVTEINPLERTYYRAPPSNRGTSPGFRDVLYSDRSSPSSPAPTQFPPSPLEQQVEYLRKAKTDEQRETVKKRIEKLLSDQYDSYLDNSESELSALEERLTKLREKLKTRSEAKEELVRVELQRVVNEAQGVGWPRQNQTQTTRAQVGRYAAQSFIPIQRGDTRDYRFADRSPSAFSAPVARPSQATLNVARRVAKEPPKGTIAPPTSVPKGGATLEEPKGLKAVSVGCLNYESKNLSLIHI